MKRSNSIPTGWRNSPLKSLITKEIKNGYSPNCPEEPNGRWILGLGNITETGFNPKPLKPAPIDDAKVADFLLEPGDFLISRSNSIDKVGRSILFRGEIENCSYPDLLMRFRVSESQVLNVFLEAYLRSHVVRSYIQSCAAGTSGSMVKINKSVVENIPILLPPLPEQKAIADLLATWDAAIEKTERLIEAKERRFRGLMQELIVGRSDCLDLPLGEICKVNKGQQLNVSDMDSEGEYYALNGGVKPSGRTCNWNVEAGTISISEGGNSCGYVNFNTARFWSGGHCYTLENVSESLEPLYLFYFLKANEGRIMRLRVGSGLPNIQKKDLDKFKILVPALEIQIAIAGVLSEANREIEVLRQILEKYKTQKRGLMQKLLTGEWQVAFLGRKNSLSYAN